MGTIIGRVIDFPKEGSQSQKGFMNPPVEAAEPKEKAPAKRRGRGAKAETK